MAARLRQHIRSNVVGYLALFVALGGSTAWAVDKVTSREIAKNAIVSKHLKNKKAVQNKDVRPDSLTGAAINEATLSGVNARNADMLDNLNSTDFLRSDAAVNADKVDGLDANALLRVASASAADAPNGNGDILTTSIVVPQSGFLFVIASTDAFNFSAFDNYSCQIKLDGAPIPSSLRVSQLDDAAANVNEDEDCSTNTVAPVSSGNHSVAFAATEVSSASTNFAGADLGVLFIPFNATGG